MYLQDFIKDPNETGEENVATNSYGIFPGGTDQDEQKNGYSIASVSKNKFIKPFILASQISSGLFLYSLPLYLLWMIMISGLNQLFWYMVKLFQNQFFYNQKK